MSWHRLLYFVQFISFVYTLVAIERRHPERIREIRYLDDPILPDIVFDGRSTTEAQCIMGCGRRGFYGHYARGRCFCHFNETMADPLRPIKDERQVLSSLFCQQMTTACGCVEGGKCTFQMREKLKCLTSVEHEIVNLARSKPAKQSSTLGPFKPQFANDGQMLGYISSTMKQWNPWWEVDFQKISVIKLIKIYLPVQHYLELKSYMDLLVMIYPNHWYVCRHIGNVSGQGSIETSCQGKMNLAQFLRIVLGRNNMLKLLEVEVLGYYL